MNDTFQDRLHALQSSVVQSIDSAREVTTPFFHLELDHVFPDDLYAQMTSSMPEAKDFRALRGRNNVNITKDGYSTRVKMDLFPEFIRYLPEEKQDVWRLVGAVLCSSKVEAAFVSRLAPMLERRFGPRFRQVGLYPIPMLTRDIVGYNIPEHTDTHWKGITVQFYLPHDNSISHVGTWFKEKLPDGRFNPARRMNFSPNTGYAFAVGDDTWHSVDTLGPEVKTRDSILLTYFVDAGMLRFARNRSRRIGNLALNEIRHLRGLASTS
jgi:hypothetical protein